jgi:hypothetical protein
VNSPLPTEFSPYAWTRNQTPNDMLKGAKTLTTWIDSLSAYFSYFYIVKYLNNKM